MGGGRRRSGSSARLELRRENNGLNFLSLFDSRLEIDLKSHNHDSAALLSSNSPSRRRNARPTSAFSSFSALQASMSSATAHKCAESLPESYRRSLEQLGELQLALRSSAMPLSTVSQSLEGRERLTRLYSALKAFQTIRTQITVLQLYHLREESESRRCETSAEIGKVGASSHFCRRGSSICRK